jgi:hypothetical protein
MVSTKTNQVHVFYEYNIVEMWKMPRNIIKCNAFCESTMHLTSKFQWQKALDTIEIILDTYRMLRWLTAAPASNFFSFSFKYIASH